MSLIQISEVTKSYGKKKALHDVSITVESGKIIGLIGNNGSGKTTLLKLLAGLLQPSSGSVTIDGTKAGVHTKQMVSFMPDTVFLEQWMYVKDAVAFYHTFYEDFDAVKAATMLSEMKIAQEARISSLSKGALEKVQLILTLCRRAKLYVLDEPLGGVDLVARDQILQILLAFYHEERSMIISTHLIQEIEMLFDEVIALQDGKVLLHMNAEELRLCHGKAVHEWFKEVFSC
ncbi:ABC transporter ATP-binding protein [Ectobacillus sp. JY-23]|uniref:ATP-binding cassette domain-containing protein n=1 Tax=Ectobacillus sp. JY-23 TaxID=2933872 RepID=UPI001FF47EF0|nr:ABC transporter ATP-binding protein [Ectobacillus sp. JY-23]UOY92667.1 ABC transporter ATP-binding protein [Ectobacillus sp. JY-23]